MSDVIIETIHPTLNDALGGGFPLRGLVEIYGEEGVGKTATAISLSAQAFVAFLDLDGTFPHQLVDVVGRTDQIVLAQLNDEMTLSELTELIELLMREVEVVVIDPLALLGFFKEESLVPILSRLAQRYHRLVVLVNHANQYNESPSQRTTSFYCKQRVQMSRVEADSEKMKVNFRITKNALHPPFSYGTITIPFN